MPMVVRPECKTVGSIFRDFSDGRMFPGTVFCSGFLSDGIALSRVIFGIVRGKL